MMDASRESRGQGSSWGLMEGVGVGGGRQEVPFKEAGGGEKAHRVL